MQVLLVMWLLLAGMRSGLWDEIVVNATAPASTTEPDLTVSEGPYNPPPRP